MFDSLELGQKVTREAYHLESPDLRVKLLELQKRLRDASFPVLIFFEGDDGRACNDAYNLLDEWLDERHLEAFAFGSEREEESQRPFFWRFWNTLPRRGRIGVYIRGWTFKTVLERVHGELDDEALAQRIADINQLERSLTDDGALILKFWLHLPKEEVDKRLDEVRADPDAHWRIHPEDFQIGLDYDANHRIAEEVLKATSTDTAQWNVVDATHERFRHFAIAQTIIRLLSRRLRDVERQQRERRKAKVGSEKPKAKPSHEHAPVGMELLEKELNASRKEPTPDAVPPENPLNGVDLSLRLDKQDYRAKLSHYQHWINHLSFEAHAEGLSTVIAFEGMDASGKGGIIRRLTHSVDASFYHIHAISAPTEEEHAHHYLWRFWNKIPAAGRIAIFDRTWYGRLLVERVEGFAREDEWRRAFDEINVFERQIVEKGILLIKFYIHVDRDEQLRRFQSRTLNPYKAHKITAEDYRNRRKAGDYEYAVHDLLSRTDTGTVPWTLVSGNNKKYGRIQVLKTVCEALSERLGGKVPPPRNAEPATKP